MGLAGRLIIRPRWGIPVTEQRTIDVSSAVWEQARRRAGGVRGVRRLGDDDDAPIILDYKIWFDPAINTPGAWGATAEDGLELIETYANNAPGLAYVFEESGVVGEFTSEFNIEANEAWSVRPQLFTIKDNVRDVHTIRWPGWQLQVIDGKSHVMRLSAAWNQDDEDTISALLEGPQTTGEAITAEDQQTIDEIREAIYDDYQEVNLSLSGSDPVLLTFIPEPSGSFYIVVEGQGGDVRRVNLSDVRSSRRSGVVWGAGPITMRSNGPAMFWQIGIPIFNSIGSIGLGPYSLMSTGGTPPTMQFNVQAETPTGTTATLSNVSNAPLSGLPTSAELRATLTSNNSRYTPFFYSAQAILLGSERTGGSGAVWDSNNYLLNGNTCFADAEPVMESAGDSTTQFRGYNVVALDINGRLDMPNDFYGNYMCDWYVAGELKLGNGIIRGVVSTDMRNPETRVTFQLVDMWAVMDDDKMKDLIVLNGLHLGDAIRLVLRGAGVKTAEMAGVVEGTGPLLPELVNGDTELIKPEKDTPRGDFLREVMEKYGQTWVLKIVAGVWTLQEQDNSSIGTFSTTSNEPWTIFKPFDISMDYGEFYNIIPGEGETDAQGRSVYHEWRVHESLTPVAGTMKGLGRRKHCSTVADKAWRTQDAVTNALRSIAPRRSKAPKFIEFDTYNHDEAETGRTFRVNNPAGPQYEIVRIGGGSIAQNRTHMVGQLVEVPPEGAI